MDRSDVLADYVEERRVVETDIDGAAGWQRIDDVPGRGDPASDGG